MPRLLHHISVRYHIQPPKHDDSGLYGPLKSVEADNFS